MSNGNDEYVDPVSATAKAPVPPEAFPAQAQAEQGESGGGDTGDPGAQPAPGTERGDESEAVGQAGTPEPEAAGDPGAEREAEVEGNAENAREGGSGGGAG